LLCQFFGQKPGCRSTVGGPEFGGIFNLGMIPQTGIEMAPERFQKQALTAAEAALADTRVAPFYFPR
jgi:hypothetical protein